MWARVGQSKPAPTSAPTWMDGALIGFSFLSLCHIRLTFFVSPFSALISVFFLGNFIFSPPPTQFFCVWLLKLFPPTHLLPPHCPPQTYSPINLKFATLIPTYLPTLPTVLPTKTLNRYLPNPTYMATPIYIIAIAINPQWSTMMRKE